jgi:putative transcriptional regulator
MSGTRLGRELIAGLTESVAHARGTKKLRATARELPEARFWGKAQIAALRRERFGVSQPVFASYLSVKVATVRAWEQGQKTPSGAARRLLELAEIEPALFERLARMHPSFARRA